ncbi:HSP20-like chaperone [Polychytrium aggregatum]|uniref:HSP20-like chaperone n=1 Tax=Polychytrium aggregatum TaxID=110093 RepID=UPI0022FE85CC|nr:HSP20-like chaperone [Polychytrium aggregatum]KAI9207431.1 HSP20-like chaperone [Polychytrium aggregatum]
MSLFLFNSDPFFQDPFEYERRVFGRMNRLMNQLIADDRLAASAQEGEKQPEQSSDNQSGSQSESQSVSRPAPSGWGFYKTPRLDVIENETEFVVKADLPGLKKDDVHVSLLDDVLTIEGERRSSHEEKKDTYHMVECSYGQFQRKIRLPPTVDAQSIQGKMTDGVLELKIGKKALPPPPEAKKIAIN